MSYTYNGVATNHANLPLLDNGDQVSKTSLMIGIIQKIWDKILYVQGLIGGAITWAGAQVFQARVTMSGANAVLVKRYGTLADASGTVDLTTADLWRVPTTLTGARTYTLALPSAALAGFSCRVFRTKTASAHVVGFGEATSARDLGSWSASRQAWADFVWDGTKWHMCGWDVGGTDNGTSGTSEP